MTLEPEDFVSHTEYVASKSENTEYILSKALQKEAPSTCGEGHCSTMRDNSVCAGYYCP